MSPHKSSYIPNVDDPDVPSILKAPLPTEVFFDVAGGKTTLPKAILISSVLSPIIDEMGEDLLSNES
ncbi:MAG: hypothetical protein QXR62_03695 [Candidatus Bathyarchaeia archaeon]